MNLLLKVGNWIGYHVRWAWLEQFTAERLNRRNWWWSDKGWYQPRSGK